MFEVGKKYQNTDNDCIVTCVAINSFGYPVFENPNIGNCWASKYIELYKEHKEPRTLTKFMSVYEYNHGPNKGKLIFGSGQWDTKEEAKSRAKYWTGESVIYKDTVEITYTEKV